MRRYCVGLYICFAFFAGAETTLSTSRSAWEDVTIQDWKQSNEVVQKKGGWRVYLKEAQQQALSPMPLPVDKSQAEEKVE